MVLNYFENLCDWLIASFVFKKREMKAFTGVQTTEIEDDVVGFDQDIINISRTFINGNHDKAREDLRDRVKNITPKVFQIGVRIGQRHASVIVHEPKPTGTNDPSIEKPLVILVHKLEEYSIPFSERPRQLHIRYKDSTEQTMVLAADTKSPRYAHSNSYSCPRYIEVCRVLTTWQQLQFIALVGSPKEHSVVLNDCATFTINYSETLLGIFTSEAGEVEQQMEQLDKLIVIIHETGSGEGTTRRGARRKPMTWREERHEAEVSV
ncbi:hypothetical protein F4825DRAFT_338304 [Nemania diffusa]|nr:hypothetical protein F4825DRAFT_338304 [Nemania diffusa]